MEEWAIYLLIIEQIESIATIRAFGWEKKSRMRT
jgi:hypothetical protein